MTKSSLFKPKRHQSSTTLNPSLARSRFASISCATLLLGMGTNRPQLTFLNKDSNVIKGDVVSTSPASTLLPPNLPVGIIQSLDQEALPAPQASVQLLAAPEAIDWVQVQKP